MDAQRSDILNQLAAGDLSAEQAAEHLRGEARPAPAAAPDLAGRWLHVRVTRLPGGEPKVTVNVPLNWVALGLRLGARYSPELAGLDLDELVRSLPAGASGPLVDVENVEDGERVQVSID